MFLKDKKAKFIDVSLRSVTEGSKGLHHELHLATRHLPAPARLRAINQFFRLHEGPAECVERAIRRLSRQPRPRIGLEYIRGLHEEFWKAFRNEI